MEIITNERCDCKSSKPRQVECGRCGSILFCLSCHDNRTLVLLNRCDKCGHLFTSDKNSKKQTNITHVVKVSDNVKADTYEAPKNFNHNGTRFALLVHGNCRSKDLNGLNSFFSCECEGSLVDQKSGRTIWVAAHSNKSSYVEMVGCTEYAYCAVATATLSTFAIEGLSILRQYRDNCTKNLWGKFLSDCYDRIKYPAAKVVERNSYLKSIMLTVFIKPAIKILRSESKFGIKFIMPLLFAGMVVTVYLIRIFSSVKQK